MTWESIKSFNLALDLDSHARTLARTHVYTLSPCTTKFKIRTPYHAALTVISFNTSESETVWYEFEIRFSNFVVFCDIRALSKSWTSELVTVASRM